MRRYIDLFAGAGGFSAGFSAAGFKVVAALESVSRFAETHHHNFPGSQTVCGDIEKISPVEFAQKCGLQPQEDLILIGGPPCQTFSTIGTPKIRSLGKDADKSDPRNYLFRSFFDYVAFFKPPIFVMENVPSLQSKFGGKLFRRILERCDLLGYKPHISVLNAVQYGVPQVRKRLFVVGTRRGLEFRFPEPKHTITEAVAQLPLIEASAGGQRVTTVHDALSDLPLITDGSRAHHLPYSIRDPLSPYQKARRRGQATVGNNVCRISNERAKKLFPYMKPGMKYMDLPPRVRKILPFREDIFFDRLKRLHPSRPSWTVLAHIGMDGYMYIHPTENRTLSVREAARLQSFDDSFEFVGNMREQYVQVGNAVPPVLARELAKQVMRSLS